MSTRNAKYAKIRPISGKTPRRGATATRTSQTRRDGAGKEAVTRWCFSTVSRTRARNLKSGIRDPIRVAACEFPPNSGARRWHPRVEQRWTTRLNVRSRESGHTGTSPGQASGLAGPLRLRPADPELRFVLMDAEGGDPATPPPRRLATAPSGSSPSHRGRGELRAAATWRHELAPTRPGSPLRVASGERRNYPPRAADFEYSPE